MEWRKWQHRISTFGCRKLETPRNRAVVWRKVHSVRDCDDADYGLYPVTRTNNDWWSQSNRLASVLSAMLMLMLMMVMVTTRWCGQHCTNITPNQYPINNSKRNKCNSNNNNNSNTFEFMCSPKADDDPLFWNWECLPNQINPQGSKTAIGFWWIPLIVSATTTTTTTTTTTNTIGTCCLLCGWCVDR